MELTLNLLSDPVDLVDTFDVTLLLGRSPVATINSA